jgi:transglutaminase-like putative cysteine protease
MSWRVEVHHRTTYHYAGQVESNYNEARLTPVTNARQSALSSALEVSPRVTPFRYVDGFGTTVHAFDLHQPHDHLTVIGHSVTETSPPTPIVNRLGWKDLRTDRVADRFYDYLTLTPLADVDAVMQHPIIEAGKCGDPVEAARFLFDYVHNQLTYTPGGTEVSTPASAAFSAGIGVCQDFVHVSLALLRSVGIPARYVSGYVHNQPEATLGEHVWGESHAWVDVWTGDWWGFDPTGDVAVGERHVVVATGRDYRDVTPIKGVYADPRSTAWKSASNSFGGHSPPNEQTPRRTSRSLRAEQVVPTAFGQNVTVLSSGIVFAARDTASFQRSRLAGLPDGWTTCDGDQRSARSSMDGMAPMAMNAR